MSYSEFASRKTEKMFEDFSFKQLHHPSTRESYQSELNFFMNYSRKDLLALTENDAALYIKSLQLSVSAKTLAYETLYRKYSQLSSMFTFWSLVSTVADDDFKNILADIFFTEPDYLYKKDDVIDYKLLNEFFDFVRTQSFQDYVFLQTGYWSLLQLREILTLNREKSFRRIEGATYIYMAGSTRPDRTIKIPEALAENIEVLLSSHTSPHVFINRNNTPLSQRSVQKRLNAYSKSFWDKDKSFKYTDFYHTGIFQALERGMTREEIMYQTGITETRFIDRYRIATGRGIIPTSTCDFVKIVVVRKDINDF